MKSKIFRSQKSKIFDRAKKFNQIFWSVEKLPKSPFLKNILFENVNSKQSYIDRKKLIFKIGY